MFRSMFQGRREGSKEGAGNENVTYSTPPSDLASAVLRIDPSPALAQFLDLIHHMAAIHV